MPNRYAGVCYRCGELVQPGEGVFEKMGKRQQQKWGLGYIPKAWLTQHHECAAKWKGTAQHYKYNDLREKVPD